MWGGLGHHTIVNGPRYNGLLKDIFIKGKLSDDFSLLFTGRTPATDRRARGDDTFISSPVPHRLGLMRLNWKTEAPIYRVQVAAVLEEHMPVPRADKHRNRVYAETFRDRYRCRPRLQFRWSRAFISAWFAPACVEEAKGLFLVGAGTHPGAGLPGGVVASAEVLGKLVPITQRSVPRGWPPNDRACWNRPPIWSIAGR
jgi:phytoene desaturase